MIVLGGSLHHRGGLEAYCERATDAIRRYGQEWDAEWRPTDTAYASPSRLPVIHDTWRRLATIDADLIWLQWSTLLDLLMLQRIRALGLPVLVTPHLGARARLQRQPLLRFLCSRLLSKVHRLGLLFDTQNNEIALPSRIPHDTLDTFLPERALAARPAARTDGPLRLIHAGRLSAEKGALRFVALCASLRARDIAFTARIVGRSDPATERALAAAIAQSDLGNALTMTEWLDEAALHHALSEADVLVHLSELDSYPLIVLEALAAGTIPIVSDMAGAASMVHRFGGLVTPIGNSVAAAAQWIAEHDLPALRRSGAAAAERVQEALAWPRLVQQLERVADATLTSRS